MENCNGGGGGAGGLRTCPSFSVCGATDYPITVGAGGAGLLVVKMWRIRNRVQYFQQLQVRQVEVVAEIQ
jgi:hypothetical protein